jgi:general secretion pathway protein K
VEVCKDNKGFILIVVLIIISLLFPVALSFFGKAQINLLQAENFRDTIQASRMAQSGVEIAMGLLMNDDLTYDCMTDKWALPFPVITEETSIVDVTIVDDDSKLNINALVDKDGNVNSDIRDRLKNLIERLGGKADFVNAIIDWIDANNTITEPGGAEDGEYRDLGYLVKNGPMDTIDELTLIKGFDKEHLGNKSFNKFLTTAPTDGKININTAPLEILFDLGFREGLVQEIVNAREAEPFQHVSDIWRVLGVDSKSLPQGIDQKIKVNSSIFTVRSSCTVKKVVKVIEAVLQREKEGIKVLSWREF